MKNKMGKAGLVAFAAGLLLIPVIRYLNSRRRAIAVSDQEDGIQPDGRKKLFSAYRGNHLPHHRKNGHSLHG